MTTKCFLQHLFLGLFIALCGAVVAGKVYLTPPRGLGPPTYVPTSLHGLHTFTGPGDLEIRKMYLGYEFYCEDSKVLIHQSWDKYHTRGQTAGRLNPENQAEPKYVETVEILDRSSLPQAKLVKFRSGRNYVVLAWKSRDAVVTIATDNCFQSTDEAAEEVLKMAESMQEIN